VVEGVGSGLAVVEVGWRDPFGVTVFVFASGPALFGEGMVAAAAERQAVDVGGAALGVWGEVMDPAVIAGHGAARMRTPAIFGIQDNPLGR
jgi:hypothetical protein